jgi:hypothetical protein
MNASRLTLHANASRSYRTSLLYSGFDLFNSSNTSWKQCDSKFRYSLLHLSSSADGSISELMVLSEVDWPFTTVLDLGFLGGGAT